MNRNLSKKINRATTAWDLNAGCRQITITTTSRRNLRKLLRKQSRKTIERWMRHEEEE